MKASKSLLHFQFHLLLVLAVVSRPVKSLTVRLKTRHADGEVMCALDPPTVNVTMATGTEASGFPPAVACAMVCTNHAGCKHFNQISATPTTCQLYHHRPQNLSVRPGCRHYQMPGEFVIYTHPARAGSRVRPVAAVAVAADCGVRQFS